jgi:hypothetical protein
MVIDTMRLTPIPGAVWRLYELGSGHPGRQPSSTRREGSGNNDRLTEQSGSIASSAGTSLLFALEIEERDAVPIRCVIPMC